MQIINNQLTYILPNKFSVVRALKKSIHCNFKDVKYFYLM